MREFSLRRVARLEQLAKAYLKRREEERENSLPEFFRQQARNILANLACLILHMPGNGAKNPPRGKCVARSMEI